MLQPSGCRPRSPEQSHHDDAVDGDRRDEGENVIDFVEVCSGGDVGTKETSAVVDEVGGIQAFVAETVVDATGVAVIVSEEEKLEKKWYTKRGTFAAVIVATLAVSIAVPIALTSGIDNSSVIEFADSDEPTWSPSPAPTHLPTFAPTVALLPEIMKALYPVSGKALLEKGTPAYKALDWIANRDSLKRKPSDARFVQRYVAAVFYYATGGDDWVDCSENHEICRDRTSENFLSGTDECAWYGMGCRNGSIFIILKGSSYNNLVGTIPSELAQLPELESLLIKGNTIRGTIPTEFGQLRKFNTLVASNNLLESPFPEQLLDNGLMGTIFIENNTFTGPFPPKLATLPNLQLLLAYDNGFTGTIDSRFGSLPQLQALEIGKNQLTGTVPVSIASCPSLENFNVDLNKLGGSFPEAIFGMAKLKQLNLTGNAFMGTIPPTIGNMGSAFTTMTRKYVNLASNKFSAQIPPDIANIPELKELTLHNNSFVGTMPASVCQLETGTTEVSYRLTLLTSDCKEVDCSCSAACKCF